MKITLKYICIIIICGVIGYLSILANILINAPSSLLLNKKVLKLKYILIKYI